MQRQTDGDDVGSNSMRLHQQPLIWLSDMLIVQAQDGDEGYVGPYEVYTMMMKMIWTRMTSLMVSKKILRSLTIFLEMRVMVMMDKMTLSVMMLLA